MSETFVISIAGGNTVRNKTALTLNQAGDSPNNPILKGLGLSLDVKLAPQTTRFEMLLSALGLDEVSLIGWELVSANHYRLTDRVGEGVFELPLSYVTAQRLFLTLKLWNSVRLVSEERELWVKEDPPIEMYVCSAGLDWCCEMAALLGATPDADLSELGWPTNVPPPAPPGTPTTIIPTVVIQPGLEDLVPVNWSWTGPSTALVSVSPYHTKDTTITLDSAMSASGTGLFDPATGAVYNDAPVSISQSGTVDGEPCTFKATLDWDGSPGDASFDLETFTITGSITPVITDVRYDSPVVYEEPELPYSGSWTGTVQALPDGVSGDYPEIGGSGSWDGSIFSNGEGGEIIEIPDLEYDGDNGTLYFTIEVDSLEEEGTYNPGTNQFSGDTNNIIVSEVMFVPDEGTGSTSFETGYDPFSTGSGVSFSGTAPADTVVHTQFTGESSISPPIPMVPISESVPSGDIGEPVETGGLTTGSGGSVESLGTTCGIVSTAEANESAVIGVGPNVLPVFKVTDTGVSGLSPLSIPIRVMDSWRDEFNQKHFGGARYLSVFEEGFAEDAQGDYIVAEYQSAIETVTSINISNIDLDHEYRLIFRFRSELDDGRYVDKLVRFRLTTTTRTQVIFNDDVPLDSFPVPVFDETGTGGTEWKWSGWTGLDFTGAHVVVDDRVVELPRNDYDAFPSDWTELRSILLGGEVKVRFTRDYDIYANEQIVVVYEVNAQGGDQENFTVTAKWRRRYVASQATTFAPDTQFRIIMPSLASSSTVGRAFAQVLINSVEYKQAIISTYKGSVKLPLPLRSGQSFDITDIIDIDESTGKIQNENISLWLQTDNSIRLYELSPTTIIPTVVVRSPQLSSSSSDHVVPTVRRNGSSIEIQWPAQTEDSSDYEILSPSDSTGEDYFLWGPAGGVRVDVERAPAGPTSVAANLVAFTNTSKVSLSYRVRFSTGDEVDYVIETPLIDGYDSIPPEGVVGDDDLGLIYYDNKLILTKRPPNLVSLLVTGGGGTVTIQGAELNTYDWLDIYSYSQNDPSLSLTYKTTDNLGNLTAHGPYILPEFEPLPMNLVMETPNNKNLWVTGRLLETTVIPPKANIDISTEKITFDYENRFTRWIRWSVTNPHDGSTITNQGAPPNLSEVDISRVFRSDVPYNLQTGQRLLVTLLHRDGPHVTVLYKINGTYVEPQVLTYLRGALGE